MKMGGRKDRGAEVVQGINVRLDRQTLERLAALESAELKPMKRAAIIRRAINERYEVDKLVKALQEIADYESDGFGSFEGQVLELKELAREALRNKG